jgi:hypothetical protein
MPCVAPPRIWPSTSAGLSARPTSWAIDVAEQLDLARLAIDADVREVRGDRGRRSSGRAAVPSIGS